MKDLRREALEALLDITERGAYANLRLKKGLEGLSQRDARWVSAAVYTTLDHLLYIDYILAAFAKGRIQPAIRGVLRLGLSQVLFMNVPDNAACDESVSLCKRIGKGALSGYVNGVMRAVCRQKENLPALPKKSADRLSVKYSWPLWLVQEYLERYGETFTEAMLAGQPYSGMTLRAQRPFTLEDLAASLQAQGTTFQRGVWCSEALRLAGGVNVGQAPWYIEGQGTVQSESAMLVCRLLEAAPGMGVLDACAAPGGKTSYLSQLMKGTGHIDAWELHPHRCKLLQSTLKRLHVENASVAARDASVFDPALENTYERVLVDAPCSGLGIPGKPDVRYAKSDGIIQTLAAVQADILHACASYVRPGGVLVYATCTISYRENEGQIQRFLQEHSEFHPGNMDVLPPALRERARNGMVQLFPHLDCTEGFFMARLEKQP